MTKQPLRLVSIGAFYKEDTEVGYGWITETPHLVQTLCECVNRAREAYKQWMEDEKLTKRELANILIEQTETEICPRLNLKAFGTTRHPNGPGPGIEVETDFSEEKEYFVLMQLFFMNVSWLVENGFIRNDNWNGMSYMYESNPR